MDINSEVSGCRWEMGIVDGCKMGQRRGGKGWPGRAERVRVRVRCSGLRLRECESGAKPGGGDTVVTCSKQREVCEIALAVGGGRLRVGL
jgi:hypothetical protein